MRRGGRSSREASEDGSGVLTLERHAEALQQLVNGQTGRFTSPGREERAQRTPRVFPAVYVEAMITGGRNANNHYTVVVSILFSIIPILPQYAIVFSISFFIIPKAQNFVAAKQLAFDLELQGLLHCSRRPEGCAHSMLHEPRQKVASSPTP